MITYLDSDDEYYPDFLWNVDHFASRGDVQVFGYDVVDDDHLEKPVRTWDPSRFKSILFGGNLAAPLGIAHRRDLALESAASTRSYGPSRTGTSGGEWRGRRGVPVPTIQERALSRPVEQPEPQPTLDSEAAGRIPIQIGVGIDPRSRDPL